MRPLVIDLCCGRMGWAKAFLDHGWDYIGFDIEDFARFVPAGAKFCQRDVLALNGHLFRGVADLVVASPVCTKFSRHDQPGLFPNEPPPDMTLVDACFEFARAAGVPLVLENVRGLQKFIGAAIAHYGSFYMWGDGVPALLPHTPGRHGRVKLKWKHRTPSLRAKIPYELAHAVAAFHTNRFSGSLEIQSGRFFAPHPSTVPPDFRARKKFADSTAGGTGTHVLKHAGYGGNTGHSTRNAKRR